MTFIFKMFILSLNIILKTMFIMLHVAGLTMFDNTTVRQYATCILQYIDLLKKLYGSVHINKVLTYSILHTTLGMKRKTQTS